MIAPNKPDCTGCGACHSICSVPCISMKSDTEGFLYPALDESKCTKCKECEKVCPSLAPQKDKRRPLHVYAAKNPDEETRYQSSSGGIFSLIAENIIQEGGVVFGARFNDAWEVVHDYTETIEGLAAFRGSKYVQSITGNTYIQAKKFLENNRKVLYSGTPCQIAGLKAFLKNDHSNLLALDFVCHGVPSPLVWKKYFTEIIGNSTPPLQIHNIKFRDKTFGWNHLLIFAISFFDEMHRWKRKHFTATTICKDKKLFTFTETSNTNSFMKGFLSNLFLRPSCHACPVKSLASGSDITIADYWGVKKKLPDFDDGKGVSLVMVNTENGKKRYDALVKNDRETTYAEAFAANSTIEKSVLPHKRRILFFKALHTKSVIALIDKLTADSLKKKIWKLLFPLLKRFKLLSWVRLQFHKGKDNNENSICL